jgi:hypothetical protein
MAYLTNENDSFFKEILPSFAHLSKTEKGLNVIKKFIAFLKCEAAQKLVIKAIEYSYIDFIEDTYCNYATQIIIKTWPPSVTVPLFPLILGKIERFSTQRASSNVVEIMLVHSPMDIKKAYFKEIAQIKKLHSKALNRNHTE